MFKNEYPLFFIKIFINTFDPQMITPRKIIRRVIPVIIAFSVIWTVISGLMSFHAGLHKGPLEHICVFILPKKHNENIPFSVNDLNNTTLISIGSSKVDFCISCFKLLLSFDNRENLNIELISYPSLSYRGPPQIL